MMKQIIDYLLDTNKAEISKKKKGIKVNNNRW